VHAEYLVRMANDIAGFFRAEAGTKAPEEVAGHIRKFWDPRMRKQIQAYVSDGGAGLLPEAKRAVELLATMK
jgi:formate dehydrogenase subunit delta